MNPRDHNRDFALRLAEAGLPVFPCGPDKKPLVPWRNESTADPQRVADLWCDRPGALPGIDLAKAGLVVLDGDRHGGPDGVEALRELFRSHGVDARHHPIIKTPNNGVHVYLKQNGTALTNARGELPPGIDIRGVGGYVIAPFATLPDGSSYEPLPGTQSFFDAIANDAIPHAPEWLVEIVRKPERKASAPVAASGTREESYARAALEGIARDLSSTPKGQRNEVLNKAAFRIGTMVARGWVSRNEVELRLLAAAHENGLAQDDGRAAAEKTINSGLDAGLEHPHEDLKDRDRERDGATHGSSKDTFGEDESRPPAFTDEALALAFAERHSAELRYVAAWGRWLRYDGTHWQFDETLLAFDLARRICREAAASCNKSSTANGIASAKTVAAVERLAKADRRLAATIDQWDADQWLLNTPTGVIDLRTGQVRPQQPTDYFTKITAVGPSATPCPRWKAHLNRILNADPDLVSYIQRVLGYALTGQTTEHALFFGYGTGANGKGVTINTAAGILKDYAQTASVETFTASHTDRHTTELAALRGARLVTVAETEEGRRWAESRIKTLTGGDPIRARYMRQDEFEFLPQLKLLISGNHKPGLRSVDEAIRRRFHLIPFTVTIPPEERDQDLTDKLRAEWPGILAWMIEGCLDWQKHGLNPPAAVRDATAAYLDAQDALGAWIEECCNQDPHGFETRTSLFNSWSEWANASGEHVGTRARFLDALEGRGFEPARTAGRGFRGLRIIPRAAPSHWSDQ